MKTYKCACGQRIFFQNALCVNCHRELGFLPDLLWMTSLDPVDDGLWRPTAKESEGALYRKCQNYTDFGVCNWMVAQKQEGESFCVSCRMNEIIPDLSLDRNRESWAAVEGAKRRLVYTLIPLNLPVASKKDEPQNGIAFRFLSEPADSDGSESKVLTGHDHGTITLNIAEADDATRERTRHAMHEPYRTLLGHFRHEIGHYYWERLVEATNFLAPFRELFGDEQADYNEALSRYYQSGAPANWQESFVSAYATAHPWEDWAETWAHFLHIQDTLEVAYDFGFVKIQVPLTAKNENPSARPSSKPATFDQAIAARSELAVGINSINRSMGQPDLYPFVLPPAVIAKLHFIYMVIGASVEAVSI
jgi:hypothetical protein